ncbi:cadmium resistance transporter [Arthrobacter ulcerisalmonis]|uniref:cadmium resistance transporter n=1 Tax=Arthrobacter ulcerisalmonis TaxID=2483813 RepID=UPI00362E0309
MMTTPRSPRSDYGGRRDHDRQRGRQHLLYTPIFRTSSPGDVAVMIVVFLILVAVWCAAGRLIGTHKAVTETLERVEHWLVPVVFIGLGLFILIESGVIVRLFEALA